MIDVYHIGKGIKTLVAGSNLVCRHSAEHGIRPASHLSGMLIILRCLTSHTTPGRGIMTIKHFAVDVGRKEISERNHCKKQHHQHVWQITFPIFHYSYNCFYFPFIIICLQN